jgi:MFS family permease
VTSIKSQFGQIFRAYPKIVWYLAIGCFMNVGGLSFLWPVNTIYIHSRLHQPMTVAGVVLMGFSGAGFIGNLLGGYLYDKFGAIRVLQWALLISILSIIVPVFIHSFFVYVVVMIVFGAACALPFPILNAMAAHAWPEGGRRAFNFLYVANNLGVAVGTAAGGFLAQTSFTTVFLGIACTYAVFIVLIRTVFYTPFLQLYQVSHEAHKQRSQRGSSLQLPWGSLSLLMIGFVLAWSVYVQWQSTIPVYMQTLGDSLSSYSVLWTMNGLLIFLTQPLVSFVVRRIPKLSYHMMLGVCLFILSFVLLLCFHTYSAFFIAMMLLTLGEIFVWPAVPAAVSQVAPQEKIGLLQGMVGSAATFGRMVGPLWGGALYDAYTMHAVLLWSVGILGLPLLLFALYQRLTRPAYGEILNPATQQGTTR